MTPKEILKRPYNRIVNIHEDGTVSVAILEFPGCIDYGNNIEEVLSYLEKTAESWLEAVIELGQDIPEPVKLTRVQKLIDEGDNDIKEIFRKILAEFWGVWTQFGCLKCIKCGLEYPLDGTRCKHPSDSDCFVAEIESVIGKYFPEYFLEEEKKEEDD